MRWTVIAAAACVFLLLAALFEDIGAPLCVMATFPLAMIGVLWGLMVTDTALNPMVFRRPGPCFKPAATGCGP